MEDKDRLLKTAQTDLVLEKRRASETSSQRIESRLDNLFGDLAGPIAQLMTQENLLVVQRKELQANDVLTVAKQLIASLCKYGLNIEEQIGQILPFDHNRHAPLSLDESILQSQAVTVKMVGLSYKGRVIRRAMVTSASATEASRG